MMFLWFSWFCGLGYCLSFFSVFSPSTLLFDIYYIYGVKNCSLIMFTTHGLFFFCWVDFTGGVSMLLLLLVVVASVQILVLRSNE